MAYCGNCGTQLDEKKRFCPECGKSNISQTGARVGQGVDKAINFAEINIPEVRKQLTSDNKRYFSPALFILALFCLLLPFLTLSCGGQEIVTLTVVDLATGIEIYGERADGNIWAILLIITLVAGLVFSILKGDQIPKLILGSASAGLLSLIIIAVGVSNELSEIGINSKFRFGFYLLLMTLLGIVGLNAYFLSLKTSHSGIDGQYNRIPPRRRPNISQTATE